MSNHPTITERLFQNHNIETASKSTPRVSVLIPAYNAGKYIAECLESVLAQDFQDWEAIVINDGSKDNTEEICREYARRDARIRLLSQENAGLAETRNRLIENAFGDWLVFLDSDDILPRYNLGMLLKLAEETGCDIAGGRLLHFSAACPADDNNIPAPVKMSREEAVKALLYQTEGPDTSSSAKIYRASLWKHHRYRKGIIYEDLDVIYRVFLSADAYLHIPHPFYYYRSTPGSILHTFTPRRLDVLDVTDRIEKYMEIHNKSLLQAARDRRFSAAFNILLIYASTPERDRDVEQRCIDIIRSRRYETLKNNEARLKNRLASLFSYIIPPALLISLLRMISRK